MKEHSFQLDTSSSPGKFEFSETFNVVVPFIDRHLAEDRGDKIAILCSNGESRSDTQNSQTELTVVATCYSVRE